MTYDKQSVLRAFAPRVLPIEIEHEGVKADFFVIELSAKQIFDLQLTQKSESWDSQTFAVHLLVATLCDEKGKPCFTEADVRQLVEWKFGAFNKLSTAVADKIGLKPLDKKEGQPAPNA